MIAPKQRAAYITLRLVRKLRGIRRVTEPLTREQIEFMRERLPHMDRNDPGRLMTTALHYEARLREVEDDLRVLGEAVVAYRHRAEKAEADCDRWEMTARAEVKARNAAEARVAELEEALHKATRNHCELCGWVNGEHHESCIVAALAPSPEEPT